MLKSLVILSLLVCNSLAFWGPCTGGRPAPTSVTSPNCTPGGCVVARGDDLLGNVFFTPTASHGRLDAFLVVNGVFDVPLTPPRDDACNSLFRGGAQVSCPTAPNTEHEWRLNLPVPTDMPAFDDATFMFELVDVSTLQVVTCFVATGDLV